ncbi:MAG: hypothetical protein CMJ94_07200 [Planctomycetes bacterium]|nr:hypothetical protein [Planctomycetota bacterium]
MSPSPLRWHRVVPLTCLLGACTAPEPELPVDRASGFDRLEIPRPEARQRALMAEEAPAWELREASRARFVEAALEAHPDLRAQFASWQAAMEEQAIVGALPAPQLRFTEFVEEVQTRTGPQQRRLGVSQRFPWPGVLDARQEQADARARAMSYAVAELALQIVRRVELAYDEYAYLARDRQVLLDLLDLLKTLEPIVQARVRAGASQEDLLRLQIEIGRVEDDLAANRAQRRAQFAELLEAVGRDEPIEELPELTLKEAQPRRIDREEVLRRVIEQSPTLARWEALYEAALAEVRVDGYSRKPSFVLGAETILTGDAPVAGVPGSGDDPWMVSIGIELPIWGASYDASARQARHRVAEARARWESATLKLRTQVERFAFREEDAARRIALYQDSLLPRAEEVVQLALARYRAGEAAALDWIDAQRTLLALRRAYWRAQLDHQLAQVELRALTAERLP